MITEEQIRQIVREEIQNAQLNVNALSTSTHTHNGVDSKQLQIKTINIPQNTGIPFNNGTSTSYNMYIIDAQDGSGLVIEPNTGTFGGTGGTLYLGGGFTNNGQFLGIDMNTSNAAGTHTVSAVLSPNGINPGLFFTTNGTFALTLPDATQPSAVKGMLSFNSANLYTCLVTGTWLYIPTSTGTTTASTTATGTIDLIINGTTYKVLYH